MFVCLFCLCVWWVTADDVTCWFCLSLVRWLGLDVITIIICNHLHTLKRPQSEPLHATLNLNFGHMNTAAAEAAYHFLSSRLSLFRPSLSTGCTTFAANGARPRFLYLHERVWDVRVHVTRHPSAHQPSPWRWQGSAGWNITWPLPTLGYRRVNSEMSPAFWRTQGLHAGNRVTAWVRWCSWLVMGGGNAKCSFTFRIKVDHSVCLIPVSRNKRLRTSWYIKHLVRKMNQGL